jgi:hypothetical protein
MPFVAVVLRTEKHKKMPMRKTTMRHKTLETMELCTALDTKMTMICLSTQIESRNCEVEGPRFRF